ncbi:MAG: family peptidase [Parcubacteria group bacterium]|nr:family peptidase [Parcubacteria group bacterium]
MSTKRLGFDTRDIDPKVRPQDDFFHHASGGWLKRNPIPKAEARWGSFTILRHTTDKQLQELLMTVVEKKKVVQGTPEQMIRDLYRAGVDVTTRKALGITPLAEEIRKIEAIKTPADIVRRVAHLSRIGSGGIWGTGIDQDMRNSEKYIIYMGQGGLGMPDRDYYLKNDAESTRVREAYQKYLVNLLTLAGRRASAKTDAEIVYKIEETLAKGSMSKEDLRDVDKVYLKKTLPQLKKLTAKIDWDDYFKILGITPTEMIVMQPAFFKAAEKYLYTFSLEEWKTYLFTHLISDFSSALTPSLEKESFAFYGTVLSGTKHMKPLWRRILRVVNGSLDEVFGELYVDTYFPKDAKQKVSEIVDDLFTAYEARISGLDWMTPATKKKAVIKLHQMHKKLGYPDKWKNYKGLSIKEGDYVGNLIRVSDYEHRRESKRLLKPVDHNEWFMSPQTVNAYCSFMMNDVVFPAAILQPPFFDVLADDGFNYGAIGSVIGHEITHGFDDQGCKFDGHGNRKTWWTPTDTKLFTKKAKKLIDQFNTYSVAPGVSVNGQLTLGENIADLGGLSIAYDAYQLRLARTGRKDIGGYTPEQRFFYGYAATERENERIEATKTAVLTDPHSPGIFRVNGPMSNLPEFYEAFGVKKGHKLYREPKDRAKIW